MTERNLRSEKEIEIANKQGGREGGIKILSSTTFLIHLFINLHQILIAFSFLSHYQNKGRKLWRLFFFVRFFSSQNLCIAACAILKPNQIFIFYFLNDINFRKVLNYYLWKNYYNFTFNLWLAPYSIYMLLYGSLDQYSIGGSTSFSSHIIFILAPNMYVCMYLLLSSRADVDGPAWFVMCNMYVILTEI